MDDLTPETLRRFPPGMGQLDLAAAMALDKHLDGHATAWKSQVASLTARLEKARRLERYAHHIDGCETGQMATDHCDCGLSDLFAAIAAEEGRQSIERGPNNPEYMGGERGPEEWT
jgi:hypothetical protein